MSDPWEWLIAKTHDLSDWTDIGPKSSDPHHLWKIEGEGWPDWWGSVALDGEYGTLEYRECVLCGLKQIREPQS